LKSCKENESIKLGKRLLEQALTAYSTDLSSIPYDVVTALLDELSLKKVESLLSEIGLGNHSAPLIARRLVPVTVDGNSDTLQPKAAHVPLLIQGTEGMVINMAKCCRPIPGDPIFGFFSAGKGIVIHHQSCKNIAIYKKRPDSWVEIQWDESDQSEYTTEIYIEVSNQRGVLALVAFAISEMNSNIDNVHVEDRDGLSSTIIFTLSVKNRIHLARIMKRIRLIKTVMKIYRAKG
jgi:(p)ppGpp synthase/HD superfamily hydrolase